MNESQIFSCLNSYKRVRMMEDGGKYMYLYEMDGEVPFCEYERGDKRVTN